MKQKHISFNMQMGLWFSAAALLVTASSPFSNNFRTAGNDAVPFAPIGWSDPIVVTNLEVGVNVDVDIAIANNGTVAITDDFPVCLHLDGNNTAVNCWTVTTTIASGASYIVADNYSMTPVGSEGSHSLEVRIDEMGAISAEDDTSNNNWSGDFTWVDSSPSTTAGAVMADSFTVPELAKPAAGLNDPSNSPETRDTSAYMIGKVAVSVILPEGNITSTENWTQAEITQVKNEITAGLAFWETEYTTNNGGNPGLDFVIEWHTNEEAPVLIPNDPIAFLGGMADQDVWIDEIYNALSVPILNFGNPDNYLSRAYAYNNTVRTANSADWAFTIFVVDSSADADGRFKPDNTGPFAYSYLNGPFVVMTYDNANWGITQMNEVLGHQVAHIFGAADQHTAGCINTTDKFGYLEIPNSNCGIASSSLMYTGGKGTPDITTRQQVGWRNSDADQIFDPADTSPVIINFVDDDPAFTGTNHIFSGTAEDNYSWTPALTNGPMITIRKLIAIEYRVDGGAWLPADITDGILNSSDRVNFSFATPANLGGGIHIVDVRATNSANNSSVVGPTEENISRKTLTFSNDNFASAEIIPSLPYINPPTNTMLFTAADVGKDVDLLNCGGNPNLDRTVGNHSAWYRYTPTVTESVTVDTLGSDFDTMLGVYLEEGSGVLTQRACDDDSLPDLKSQVVVALASGRTYYFVASSFNGAIFGSEVDASSEKQGINAQSGEFDPGGNLVFNVKSNGAVISPPSVLSSELVDPSPNPYNNVSFVVTFSESVTGVDEGDFDLTTTGISGAAVSGLSGSGSTYVVSVNTGSGNGTIRLNVVSNGTIFDVTFNPLESEFTGGETYIIDKNYPYVLSSVRVNPSPTNLSTVGFTVTFSEPVTGVDAGDFALILKGSGVSTAAVVSITPASGFSSVYTVNVSTGAGNGIIRLNVVNNLSIVNATSFSLFSGFTGGDFYRIKKFPIFDDVPFIYWANDYIERLYYAGVTGGCSATPLNYCPDSTVTRAQMAIFLLKAVHGSSFSPPAAGSSTGFTDVPVGYWADKWIKQLAAEGITSGCGTSAYCPEATVTRAQMAIFLLKAKHGSAYTPPNATGVFTDVPVGYWAAKWIEQLAVEGVTSGCGGTTYCPDSPVTRAQMAIFIVKTFGLP